MGIWDDQVGNHATTQAVRQSLHLGAGLTAIPPEIAEVADRVVHVLGYIAGLLARCDARLLTPTMLDAPLSAAQAVAAELTAFASDDDVAHLHEANAAADQLLDVVRTWPGFTTSTEEVAAARAALAAFEDAAAAILRAKEDDAQSVAGQLEELRERLTDARASFDGAITSAREAASTAQAAAEQRLEELTATVDTQKARLDQAISEYQSQFSSAQEERSRAAEELRSAQTAEFQAHIKRIGEDAEAEMEARRTDVDVVFQEINRYRDQAAKVTEAIGITGMAEGFRKDADEQKKAADQLRVGAVSALVATAVLAIWAATATRAGAFQGTTFLARIVVSAAVGSIATYLIIQSAHHRERERRARKVELELASIDPYLALMPSEVSVEVKTKLADAWFGQPVAPIDDPGGAHAASIPVAEFIQAVIKLGSK